MNDAKQERRFPECGHDERNWYLARIEPESGRLMQTTLSLAHLVVSLLAGANAGGAVALLTYMSSPGAQIPGARMVLTLFVVGFILALLLAAGMYYAAAHEQGKWAKEVGNFYEGQRSWRELWDTKGLRFAWLLDTSAWISFALFVAGAWMGISQLLEGAGAS